MIGHVTSLNSNLICDELGVVPNAPDKRRTASGLPRQANEVEPRLLRHPALMSRATLIIKCVRVDPVKIEVKTRRPEDRAYTGLGKV